MKIEINQKSIKGYSKDYTLAIMEHNAKILQSVHDWAKGDTHNIADLKNKCVGHVERNPDKTITVNGHNLIITITF
jgi:hypothetical protein